MEIAPTIEQERDAAHIVVASQVRELRDSLVLLALTAGSLSAYVGLGAVAVRLFASR